MGYFKYNGNFTTFKYQLEWEKTLAQIQNWKNLSPSMKQIDAPLEVKALHIFTMSRRFLSAVRTLVEAQPRDTEDAKWHLIFVETSTLLFPILELVGEALSNNKGDKLGVGIYWLNDPEIIPPTKKNDDVQRDSSTITRLQRYMDGTQHHIPSIGELYYVRNYYLHGIIPPGKPKIPLQMEEVISYQLPKALACAIEAGLRFYWKKLCEDDGNQGWLERLATADIHPFIIRGSNGFEAGLIDPDIVDYLLNAGSNVFS